MGSKNLPKAWDIVNKLSKLGADTLACVRTRRGRCCTIRPKQSAGEYERCEKPSYVCWRFWVASIWCSYLGRMNGSLTSSGFPQDPVQYCTVSTAFGSCRISPLVKQDSISSMQNPRDPASCHKVRKLGYGSFCTSATRIAAK